VCALVAAPGCDQASHPGGGADPGADAGADAGAGAGAGAGPNASAGADPSARIAAWDHALQSAQTVPCRAIAVDGPVRIEGDGEAGSPDASTSASSVLLHGELPTDVWLALGADARLVAKDPRTTRETSFVGPARVRPCVAHREESWIAAGRFESAAGAGETPGAEEWAVTPLGVARYMAAQLQLDVQGGGVTVTLGTGVAFLWLADDAHEAPAPKRSADADAGDKAATTSIDDDGWRRMTAGSLRLARTGVRPPADAARGEVDRCLAFMKDARDRAAALLGGLGTFDAGAAKDQLKTRRIARASCDIAALRVEVLPPSKTKTELATRLVEARAVRGTPAAPPAASELPGSPPLEGHPGAR
jgi:hypothetical protein